MKVLLVARFVNRVGAFSTPFLAALLVHDRGASVRLAGLIVGAFGVATIPSRLLGGRLAIRAGARRAVLFGLAGTAVAQALICAVPALPAALVASILLGLFFEVYEPACQALIADLTCPAQRARMYGLFGSTLAAAGLFAGLLAAAVGRGDLSRLFAADAVSTASCLVVVAIWLPATPRRDVGCREDRRSQPWADARLLLLMATGTSFAVVYMIVPMVMPLALSVAGRPPADAGLLDALAGVVVLASPSALRTLKLSAGRGGAGYALIAAGLAMAGLHMTMDGYVVATVSIALGDAILLGSSQALVASIAPEGRAAEYFAVYGITWGVALTVGPLLMGQLLHGGYEVFWLTCAAVMTATGIAHAAIERLIRRAGGRPPPVRRRQDSLGDDETRPAKRPNGG